MDRNVKVKENIIFRDEGDEGFLFNPDTEEVKILNETGMFIWQLCDGNHTGDEIVARIDDEFEGALSEEIKRDLEKFLEELKKLSLLNA